MKNANKDNKNCKVKIIPLGGLEQIGMNMTAIEYEDSIIVMDCGLAFPSDDMLGIDLVIPDVTYLTDNIDKVKGFVITHGHEDHIGAIPSVLRECNAPIYATRLTCGIIETKLSEHKMPQKVKMNRVRAGDTIKLGVRRAAARPARPCALRWMKGTRPRRPAPRFHARAKRFSPPHCAARNTA